MVGDDFDSFEEIDNVFAITNGNMMDTWILDSACYFHICSRRDWFTTYQFIDMGIVQLRYNFSLLVVGIGTIQIKMFDAMVRTFYVKHVPDMKKNLISLSLLDKKGYKYSGQDGVLNVSKGALTIMKGKLSDDLYCLVGNTIIETVSVVSSNDPDDDVTRLWHMRFGHMSERGLEN